MKRALNIVAIAFGLALGTASGADEPAVLRLLAEQVQHVRSLPAGTDTNLRCPGKLDELIGVPKSTIVSRLKEPDYEERLDDGGAPLRYEISYFLAAPKPTPTLADGSIMVTTGGGFPIVTMFFDSADLVRKTECSYAR